METPNTRSRAKRGLNDDDLQDEGGTVRWAQDQRLRRMMVEATAGVPIPIPSPTQRLNPRSIYTPKSSSSTSGAGSSTRPPARKRPCRAHRSLPSQLSTLATPDHDPYINRSSSVPTQPKGDGGVLDDLLDRAFKTFSVQTPTVAASKSGIGGMGGIERQVSSGSSSSGGHTSLPRYAPTATRPVVATKQTVPARRILAEQPLNDPPKHTPASSLPSPSKPLTLIKQTQPPNARQVDVPRVGLSSTTKPPLPSEPPQPSAVSRNTAPSHSHRFKPPFIQQPIRCSPRRPPPAVAQPPQKTVYQTPTRPPRAPPSRPAPSRTPSRNSSTTRQAQDSLRVPGLAKQIKDAPSSDSVGDESFDSFDGMFQAGGDDVEALLKQVDGGGGM